MQDSTICGSSSLEFILLLFDIRSLLCEIKLLTLGFNQALSAQDKRKVMLDFLML